MKADGTAEDAVQQIRARKYAGNFYGKLWEEPRCTERILAVRIAYDRKDMGQAARV
ncbi:MAG: hypothetical protein Q4C59_04015 [Lachnospiraceae bacterium]|nr:hypothetical protein [Lachnospiraceae bacterium]